MARLYSNNYSSTLAIGISDSATTISVTSGTGLPTLTGSDYCHLTLITGTTMEIVKVTAISGISLTVTRAQEGTTAVAWAAGTIISLRATKASFDSPVVATGTFTTGIDVGGNATASGYVDFYEDTDNGTNKTRVIGASSMASNKTQTLQDVTGTILVTGGSDVDVADGGTGRSTATAYAPIVGGTTSTGAHQSTASGSAGQVLQSNGSAAIPTWSTPTYPSSSDTSGKFLVSDGTNNVYSTSTIPTSAGATALKHLRSDGTNYILTTATISDTPSTAGKILVSDGTNWITSTPTFPNASATSGKIIKSDGTNWVASTETFAAPGTSGNVLTSDGTNWTSAAPTGGSGGGGKDAYTTTATAAGTTTLTSSSNYQQYFTGSTTQTVVMPVTSTLTLGYSWRIVNNSTGVVTVQSSGANTIIAMPASTECIVTCILTSGTTASSWDYQLQPVNSSTTGTGSTVRASSPALVAPTADNFIDGYTTTATAAGTTTLTVSSTKYRVFTGSTTQTCVLPAVSTLVLGTLYIITNLSTGVVTVQSSGANTIQAMAANTTLVVQSNATSGTGASVWNVLNYIASASDITGSGSSVRATSPTFVTPTLGAATATSVNFGTSTMSTYDEGTWTPVPLGSSVAGSPTGTFDGRYIKIGKVVHLWGRMVFTSLSTMAGNLLMDGMPFTYVNATGGRGGVICGYKHNWTNKFPVTGFPNNNSTRMNFYDVTKDNTTVVIGDLTATTNAYFYYCYEATT